MYGLARAVLVGVGAGAIVAIVVFLVGLRRFRPRLQDKILGSYFAVSLVPLLFLGYANWRDAVARAEQDFRERQTEIARSSRREIERTVRTSFEEELGRNIAQYADLRVQDLSVYRAGALVGSSLRGLVEAEILPHRLDGGVHRAPSRRRAASPRCARRTWPDARARVGLHPPRDVRAAHGRPRGPAALRQRPRGAAQAAETGSVLLAAYLLAFVLVVVDRDLHRPRPRAPLASLSDATRRVAGGDLDTALPRAAATRWAPWSTPST